MDYKDFIERQISDIREAVGSDIAIINLEIAHLSTANHYDAITLRGATRWLIEDNYIDGAWEMWCVACDRVIRTRPGCADLHIPGAATRSASDVEK